MAKVLVEISEEELKRMRANTNKFSSTFIILNGIVLDSLTNGEVMQKLFPEAKISFEEEWDSYDDGDVCRPYVEKIVNVDFGYEQIITFSLDFWNAKWGE